MDVLKAEDNFNFVIHFYEDEQQCAQCVIPALVPGSNTILSFSALQEFVRNNQDGIEGELQVFKDAKLIQNDEDIVATVRAALTNGEKDVKLVATCCRSDWELVETASQLSNFNHGGKSENVDMSQKNNDEDTQKSEEYRSIPDEDDQDEPTPSLKDEGESESQEKEKRFEEDVHVDKDFHVGTNVPEKDDQEDVKAAQQKCESVKSEASDARSADSENMPREDLFNTSQLSLKFDLLSEDLSKSSLGYSDWTLQADKKEDSGKQDEICTKESQTEEREPKLIYDFPEPTETTVNNESGDLDMLIEKLRTFLTSPDRPNEMKMKRLMSFLMTMVEDLLKQTTQLKPEISDFLEDEIDGNMVNQIKILAENEDFVRELLNALSSGAVLHLLVDLARNDARTNEEIRKILLVHLGDLFQVLGNFFRNAPQALSLLPYLLRWISSFLEGKDNELEEKKIVHKGIICDGCDCTERKAQAMQNKTIHKSYIAGIRYKSAIRANFDLCESCEESGDFDEEYGPFLKIRTPAKSPREIVCLLQTQQSYPHFTSDDHCTKSQEDSKQVNKPEVNETQEQENNIQNGSSNSNQASTYQEIMLCPRGQHALNSFLVPNRLFACDVCDSRPSRGSQMFGCRLCDWDICMKCARKKFPGVTDWSSISTNTNTIPEMQVLRPPTSLRPRANFVADMNFQDGSILPPNFEFTKIWRVKNISDHIPWPNESRIVCVGGDPMGAPENGYLVPPLPPKQVGDICVQLRTPSKEGRYTGYWRLITPNNARFGQRFWVDIAVSGQKSNEANEQPEAKENTTRLKKWSRQLQQLADMDFLDCDNNVKLLEENRGDINKVIALLLGKQ